MAAIMARYYPLDDVFFNIARDLVKGTRYRHIFGAVPILSNNTTGTVWDINDTIYPWAVWDTASVLNISRASLLDAGKTVVLEGLDENYDEVSDTVVLTNATGNTSSVVFKRLNEAHIQDGGANAAGSITVNHGTTPVGLIQAGYSQTMMTVYTIPRDHFGYLQHGAASAQQGTDGNGKFLFRYHNEQTLRVGHTFEVSGSGKYDYKMGVPFRIPEKTDLEVRITTRTNNGRYTAAYDLILVQDGLE